MSKRYQHTWFEMSQSWFKNVLICWAAFLIISWSVEKQARKKLKKLSRKSYLGRWWNYRHARRPGETRRSFM